VQDNIFNLIESGFTYSSQMQTREMNWAKKKTRKRRKNIGMEEWEEERQWKTLNDSESKPQKLIMAKEMKR
jgi:hypothetical protein